MMIACTTVTLIGEDKKDCTDPKCPMHGWKQNYAMTFSGEANEPTTDDSCNIHTVRCTCKKDPTKCAIHKSMYMSRCDSCKELEDHQNWLHDVTMKYLESQKKLALCDNCEKVKDRDNATRELIAMYDKRIKADADKFEIANRALELACEYYAKHINENTSYAVKHFIELAEKGEE